MVYRDFNVRIYYYDHRPHVLYTKGIKIANDTWENNTYTYTHKHKHTHTQRERERERERETEFMYLYLLYVLVCTVLRCLVISGGH